MILTYSGVSDLPDIRSAFAQTVKYIEQMHPRKVYRISDIRKAEIDFHDILDLIRIVTEDGTGSSIDPRVQGVFVGDHRLIKIYAEVLKQNDYNLIAFFDTLEEALDYARQQIKAENEQNGL